MKPAAKASPAPRTLTTSTGKPVLTYRNAAAGRTAFVVVTPARGVRTSDYALAFAVK